MAEAVRDGNFVPSILFKGSDGLSYPVKGDEATGRLLVDIYGGGTGTVTSVSVVSANGFAGTVANATTTPAITLSTTITGLLKGNGTAISAAVSGTDIKTVGGNTLIGAGDVGTIGVGYGGTGVTTISALSVWVANSANTITEVTPAAGQSIRINGAGNAWEAFTPSSSVPTTITVANEATDTTCFIGFFTAATGDLGPKTNANLTFNSNTGVLTLGQTASASITGNAGTATALQNARTIGGVSFDGTANITVASATGGFTISGGNLVIDARNISTDTTTGTKIGTATTQKLGFFNATPIVQPTGDVITALQNLGLGASLTVAATTITSRTLWGQTYDGSANVTGSLTSVGNITGGASSMTILAGTGASRTLTLQTTSGASAAQTNITLNADQSSTFSGTVALGTNSLTMTGSIAATGARVTKGWFTDVESTNMYTVGGTSLSSTFAALAGSTGQVFSVSSLEVSNTDTTISRSAAGIIAVEGVAVPTISSTDTLSNKTLTAPKIANAGFIADANGNEQIIFTTTASAVNEITFANAATGGNPNFSATGGDANVGIDFTPKGTGFVQIKGNSTQAGTLAIYEDTDDGSNYSAFRGSARSGNIIYTMPTADPTAGQVLSAGAPSGGISALSWATAGGGGSYSYKTGGTASTSDLSITSLDLDTDTKYQIWVQWQAGSMGSGDDFTVTLNSDTTASYGYAYNGYGRSSDTNGVYQSAAEGASAWKICDDYARGFLILNLWQETLDASNEFKVATWQATLRAPTGTGQAAEVTVVNGAGGFNMSANCTSVQINMTGASSVNWEYRVYKIVNS